MFGDPASNPERWPVVEFGSLIMNGPTNGLYKPASAYGKGTRILRINNFYDGAIVGMNELRRLVISRKEQETYALSENDIVINRVNSREYLGKSALVPPLDEPVVFESNMMRLSLHNDAIAPKYCIDFLRSQSIKQQIARKAKDAVNQASINQSDVKSLRIMLPPIAKQREYAKVSLACLIGREVVDKAVAKGDQLFSSLQHRAFTGQL
jgi:type I restriction enzyme S subunit